MKRISAWTRRCSGASLAALYIVVVVWVFVGFPSANLSSGELKPRRLFIDENAFNLHHDIAQNLKLGPLLGPVSGAEKENDDGGTMGCSWLLRYVSSDALVHCHASSDAMTTVTVYPRHSPMPLESTLLILQVPPSVVVELINVLGKAKWMARRVVLLMPNAAPSSPPISSEALQTWMHSEGFRSAGLIRQGFVVECPHRRFHHLLLSYSSSTGVLPNMDMISFVLKLHSPMVTSLPPSVRAHSYCSKGYGLRLCGLLFSLGQQLAPGLVPQATSLPALLNEANIDSIGMVSVNRTDGQTRSNYGEADLLKLLVSLAFQSNTLEEELHHSFFFYILMGDEHFVGLPEYGLTIAVMLVSLAGLVAQVASHTSLSPSSPSSPSYEEKSPLLPSLQSSTWTTLVEVCALCDCVCAMVDVYPNALPGLRMREMSLFRYVVVVMQAVLLVGGWNKVQPSRQVRSVALTTSFLGLAVLASWNFAQALVVYLILLPLVLLAGFLRRKADEVGREERQGSTWMSFALDLLTLGLSVHEAVLADELTGRWPMARTGLSFLRIARHLL